MSQTPHIAILPSPGMGHLIPLVEFAKHLVQFNISITFLIPSDSPPSAAQSSVLSSLPPLISYQFLPQISLQDLPKEAKIETLISLTVSRSLPSLKQALKDLVSTTNLVSLVADLFGTDAFDVAREFRLSCYVFYPSTATALFLFFNLPKLDQTVSCEYRDMVEPLKLPGCVPFHGRDLVDPLQDRSNDAYKWVLHHAKRYMTADGVMVNSFMDLEGGAIKGMHESSNLPPVHPVGPLVNMDRGSDDSDLCLKWLDDQPHGSVIFVSFGSGGTLSYEQINELAWGLEMSEQRFLWAVRSPSDRTNASYFSAKSQNDPFDFLPKGFVERTKDRSVLVASWAPQAQVLRHSSTGGFLSHCGWNSTLESVVSGVPLIAWPLFAEQQMNAVMLTEGIKVGLRPKGISENGIIGREEIANVVRALMEGQEGKLVRNRMKELKEAGSRALSEDGSSTRTLSSLAHKWKTQVCST